MFRPLLVVMLCAASAVAANDDWSDGWRRVIRPADRVRLARLWPAWTEARDQVAAAGRADQWAAFGPLSTPMAADIDAGVAPPAGAYRCRVVKFGAQRPGTSPLAASPAVPCRIEADADGTLTLAGGDGAQRNNGRLFHDGARMVYLGAMTLRGDMAPFAYGRDPDRNQVGVLERIGPARWRLALPWPRWQSTLDVVDIVPAG